MFTGHHVPLVTRYITRRCADRFCSARDSLSVVQDSGFRVLSTMTDLLHCSLGHASFDRAVRMLPIVDFTTETCRDREWDNIACVHRAQGLATTWSRRPCSWDPPRPAQVDSMLA